MFRSPISKAERRAKPEGLDWFGCACRVFLRESWVVYRSQITGWQDRSSRLVLLKSLIRNYFHSD